jgi:hypothetical protein
MKLRESLEGRRCQIGYLSWLVPRAHKIAVFTASEGGPRVGTLFDTGGERRDGRAEEVPYAGSLFQCYSCPYGIDPPADPAPAPPPGDADESQAMADEDPPNIE